MNNIKVYGAIGYSVLENKNHKLLIFSDRHDKLKDCEGSKIDMNDLFQDSIDTNSNALLLLEEVERTKEMEHLKLVFDTATHTVDLKDTYIQNQKNIVGVDIRPHIIDFSLDYGRIKSNYTLKNYISRMNDFYCLKSELFKKKLGDLYSAKQLINTKLGSHFLHIKKIYKIFLNNNRNILNKPLNEKITNQIIEVVNNLLSDIMEWYICALIYKYQSINIILHTGLLHSTHVIDYLSDFYEYTISNNSGITNIENLNDADNNGCLIIPKSLILNFIKRKY
jgi:hypothetical protein